jgi:predicted acyltransferase
MNITTPGVSQRDRGIDRFRGLAIVLMVLANYSGGVRWLPAWLKHAPDVGLTAVDLIAPLFIFAIGLTYGPSFHRRLKRDGGSRTYQHFITRWTAIVGIGTILSAGEIALHVDDVRVNWGVLQAIGAAGLVSLPLMCLPAFHRAAIGVGLLVAYQAALDRAWLASVLDAPHGGLFGSLAWADMLLLATALADLYRQGRLGRCLAATAVALAGGLALACLWPLSKRRVSASYVLISLAVSAAIFLLVHRLVERGRVPAWLRPTASLLGELLDAWGANPLLLYVLHDLLLGVFFLPGVAGWYAEATGPLVAVQVVLLVGVLSVVAWKLSKKGRIFAL